jgi:hypothetical protein
MYAMEKDYWAAIFKVSINTNRLLGDNACFQLVTMHVVQYYLVLVVTLQV